MKYNHDLTVEENLRLLNETESDEMVKILVRDAWMKHFCELLQQEAERIGDPELLKETERHVRETEELSEFAKKTIERHQN